MSDENLKPCPFCGGVAEIRTDGRTGWVKCVSCGMTTWSGGYDEVVAAWNRRAAIGADVQSILDCVRHARSELIDCKGLLKSGLQGRMECAAKCLGVVEGRLCAVLQRKEVK